MTLEELKKGVPFEKWQHVLKHGKTLEMPWNTGDFGFIAGYHGGQPTEQEFEWFSKRGWLPFVCEGKEGRIIAQIVPQIFAVDPRHCFHATPSDNAREILSDDSAGLLSARKASKSTTGRIDASRFIHVSLTLDDARKWSEDPQLLPKKIRQTEWKILKIDLAGTSFKLIRDPFSKTGYIVDSEVISKEYLTLCE